MSHKSGLLLPYKGIVPTLGVRSYIAPTAVVIGDVVLGDKANIWFNCAVRGDVHEIRIGAETNIQDGSIIHVTRVKYGTYIGSRVTVAHSVTLHGCILEDRCFVGMQACIMDGAVVESEAMVAAGALVTPGQRVKKGEIWAGRPAKFMRTMTPQELAYIDISADNYVRLAGEYLDEPKP